MDSVVAYDPFCSPLRSIGDSILREQRHEWAARAPVRMRIHQSSGSRFFLLTQGGAGIMTIRKTLLVSLAIAASTTTLLRTLNHLAPTANGVLGHDYSYFLPYLLSGVQWIYQNGWLTVPYFTPDYCGGIPWLAIPRSDFYSVPQLLTTLANPIIAIKWTAITFATIGGVACYGLLRKCFDASWQAAGLAFVLFQLNTFLLFRIAVGHLTYHVFGLIPVLSWLVLVPIASANGSIRANFIRAAGKIIVAAILLAMMVYAGAPDLIIPAVLTVIAVLLVHHVRMGWQSAPWCILAGACLWAIPLSALKLVPAVILVRNYPRSYLAELLFVDPIRLFKVLAASLFAPEILPRGIAPVQGSVWLGLHEFEFGVSVVPLFLILAAILLFAINPSRPRRLLAWIALALVAAFPIALASGNEAWGRLLLKIPIIRDNSAPARFWLIYITPLIVVAGLSFDRVFWDTRVRDVAFGVSVLVVIAQLMSRDLSYYETTYMYDPAAVIRADEGIAAGVPLPEISEVGPPLKSGETDRRDNDGLTRGISAYPCYEPLFGYHHELFPARKLRAGPVKSGIDGHFNLVDPRCYLSFDSRTCQAGELFREDKGSDVAMFTSHRPLPWELPVWQRSAEAATIVSGMLSVFGLLAFVVESVFRFRRK